MNRWWKFGGEHTLALVTESLKIRHSVTVHDSEGQLVAFEMQMMTGPLCRSLCTLVHLSNQFVVLAAPRSAVPRSNTDNFSSLPVHSEQLCEQL